MISLWVKTFKSPIKDNNPTILHLGFTVAEGSILMENAWTGSDVVDNGHFPKTPSLVILLVKGFTKNNAAKHLL